MRFVDRAGLPPGRAAEVARELSGQHNLNDVMRWALAHPAGVFEPSVVAAVVAQDEYTHDVVVPWRDGLVLVYDTT